MSARESVMMSSDGQMIFCVFCDLFLSVVFVCVGWDVKGGMVIFCTGYFKEKGPPA